MGGLYTEAIEKIVYWLEKAAGVAENEQQKEVIEKLIDYYQTGDLEQFDEYAILWVKDLDSQVEFCQRFYRNLRRSIGYESELGIYRQL